MIFENIKKIFCSRRKWLSENLSKAMFIIAGLLIGAWIISLAWRKYSLWRDRNNLMIPVKSAVSKEDNRLSEDEKAEVQESVLRRVALESWVSTELIRKGLSASKKDWVATYINFKGPDAKKAAQAYKAAFDSVVWMTPTEILQRKDWIQVVVGNIPNSVRENLEILEVDASCFTVTDYEDWVSITSYDKSCWKRIRIPEQIEGKDVLAIQDSQWSDEKDKHIGVFMEMWIEQVAFPDSMKRIWNNAFEDNALISIELNDGLEEVWIMAFANNSVISDVGQNKLEVVKIPNTLTLIEEWAFYDNKLQQAVIGWNTETQIWAFFDNNIEEIRLSNYIPQSESQAFDQQETVEWETIDDFSNYYTSEGVWVWKSSFREKIK